ncbi:AraC family transcriptional regulator [Musicola paradisiaca]|uniref:Transcriptional regulator, AraC family n=1 Tax=Musicola paradisiaca (strain Ech703) TaxID=579405 RepID=C6CD15_MUSP7|nr:AraC family transcriptional regulator [Musicola paradisiaca]ACS85056.1 transcriptional regulator, AraC family [Musicola paradisiaca Ech703]
MTRNKMFYLNASWRVLFKDMGISAEHVLRRTGLPDDLLLRTGQGLSTEDYFLFWQGIEDEVSNPLFPIQIAQKVSADFFDPPLFAALCSSNLMQAIQRLAKYKHLMAPMNLEISVDSAGDMTISPSWLYASTHVPQSLQVAELAFFIRLAELGTRDAIKAIRVVLPTLPAQSYIRHYVHFFGCDIQTGLRPTITFSAADSLRPFLTASDGMWKVFEPELRRRLSELDEQATISDRVRALLLELLPGNAVSVDTVASRLAMSRRTLQRRLGEEGENFRSLVNLTREKLARHYLENTRMPAGEIAFLLGFEDPNSFYRAFHEWTGQTPDSTRAIVRAH